MSPFQKILVVVDSLAEQHPELERAMQLVSQSSAELHLLDVVKDVSLTVRLLSKDYTHIHRLLVKEKQEALEALLSHCAAHGIQASGEVREGVSSQLAIDMAKQLGADLIIRSAKGRQSLQHGLLGASAQKLIRRPPCSVWLTRPAHEPTCQTIMAAVDATPHDDAHASLNRRILQVSMQLAQQARCKLIVAYVWSLYGSEMLRHRLPESEYEVLMAHNRKQHMDSFEQLLGEFDLHATSPNTRMVEGEPSSEIPTLCGREQVDLLVCGTVARHGIAGLWLGNTAERIINRAECSVLAVTPPRASE